MISTHSLLAEGDLKPQELYQMANGFQPTPSSRRETCAVGEITIYKHISTLSLLAEGDAHDPHAPCKSYRISTHSLLAEGDRRRHRAAPRRCISTHSLLAEGDALLRPLLPGSNDFNPLPPRGGRRDVAGKITSKTISTHSLLAEGDISAEDISESVANFNPLPPRGGRLKYTLLMHCV